MSTLKNTKTFKRQKSMDGQMLKAMIRTGMKWVRRYIQIAKERAKLRQT